MPNLSFQRLITRSCHQYTLLKSHIHQHLPSHSLSFSFLYYICPPPSWSRSSVFSSSILPLIFVNIVFVSLYIYLYHLLPSLSSPSVQFPPCVAVLPNIPRQLFKQCTNTSGHPISHEVQSKPCLYIGSSIGPSPGTRVLLLLSFFFHFVRRM